MQLADATRVGEAGPPHVYELQRAACGGRPAIAPRAQDRHGRGGRRDAWAKEKGWCISPGVPIGNELDESKW
eukprot:4625195-Prymnesium_polylepis.1